MQFVARLRLVLLAGALWREKNPVAENAPLHKYTLISFLNATTISRRRTPHIGNASRRGACCFGR
jgi:hypothetical protein